MLKMLKYLEDLRLAGLVDVENEEYFLTKRCIELILKNMFFIHKRDPNLSRKKVWFGALTLTILQSFDCFGNRRMETKKLITLVEILQSLLYLTAKKAGISLEKILEGD